MCTPSYLAPWQSVPWDTFAWKLVQHAGLPKEPRYYSLYKPGCRLPWRGPTTSHYIRQNCYGDLLSYQLGEPTKNPRGAPGIMLYGSLARAVDKAKNIRVHGNALLLVKIPAGTKYRSGLSDGILFLMAQEVIPIESWSLEQALLHPKWLRHRMNWNRGDLPHV